MKKIYFIIVVLFVSSAMFAQDYKPLNSNYLIQQGVSPRVLDAAASSFMQDGSFTNEVIINIGGEDKKRYNYELIFDPDYKDGMDIIIVNKSGELSKKDEKEIKHYIETSHYFSRMAQDYLYDESTLNFERKSADTVVFSYLYQKKDVDPYLRNIKRLKGEIYFLNDKLYKVVLINTQPLKHNVTNYKKEVYYSESSGGYLVSLEKESLMIKKGNNEIKVTLFSQTKKYEYPKNKELTWKGKPEVSTMVMPKSMDTIKVQLGGTLPFLGREAVKLGYKLPRPYGVAAFVYSHDQDMQFTGLEVSFREGSEMIDLQGLFDLDQSEVSQYTSMTLAKGDVWLFPFLNIMAIVGGGTNDLDGQLVINEDLRDAINDLPGWIIDIPNMPKSVPIKTSINSEVYGGGVTLAGGVGDYNLSVNYQLMFTRIIEANTTNMVHVITPMIGYMSPFGVNFMAGAQGQFYNTQLTGFIELDDADGNSHRIDYNVDFEPIKWNAIIGVYKNFNKHWEMSFQAGFGQRSSVTAIFGYRF